MKIAIASGKGGTGKTLVATNLFHVLQQAGLNVTLTDCDAEEPNAKLFFDAPIEKTTTVNQRVPVINDVKCTFCGKCYEYCSYNAIFIVPQLKVIKVLDELCHSCGACLVACEHDAITEKEVKLGEVNTFQISPATSLIEARVKTGTMSPVKVIQRAIKESQNSDVVILDAPPGTSCPFIHTVNGSDYVVLVTEPTWFGLSNLQQAVNTLKVMKKPYGVIINRSGKDDDIIFQYIQEENIPLLMEIPFNRSIALLYSKGEIFSAHSDRYRNAFYGLYQYIEKTYGNSHHQR